LPSSHLSPLTPPPPPHTYTLSLHDALPSSQLPTRSITPTVVRVQPACRSDATPVEILCLCYLGPTFRTRRWAPLATNFRRPLFQDRKSTRLNSSHRTISYAVFYLKKKKKQQ